MISDVVASERTQQNGELCIRVNRTKNWHQLGRDKETIIKNVSARVKAAEDKEIEQAVGFR